MLLPLFLLSISAPQTESIDLIHRFRIAGTQTATGSADGGFDFDHDGVPDLLSGHPAAKLVYVYSGATGATIHTLIGPSFASFGSAVSGIDDLNGDSIPDILVGASGRNDSQQRYGYAFAYSGADGSLIFTFTGPTIRDFFGASMASAGDVNGDGFPDILIGAPDTDVLGYEKAGAAYVYSGQNGSLIFQFMGQHTFDQLGAAVSPAGDVNQDGFSDFAFSSPGHELGPLVNSGAVFIHSGATGALLRSHHGPSSGYEMGNALSLAGDVNADGWPDLIVGSYTSKISGTELAGSVDLFSGADGSLLYQYSGVRAWERLGFSVSDYGDYDGDGFDDFVFGDGKFGGMRTTTTICSGATGLPLFSFLASRIQADSPGGIAVSKAGDVNGDGVPDLFVVANRYSYVLSGDPATAASPTLTLTGTCPGTLSIQVGELSQGLPFTIGGGLSGQFTIPRGPFTGVTLDLDSPTFLRNYLANDYGEFVLSMNMPNSAFCGLSIQILDNLSLLTSNLQVIQ